MATNAGKTFIANLAFSKTKAGVQDIGVVYSEAIDDTEFADFTTGANDTVKRLCLYYETCLKRCLKEMRPDFARRYADLGNEIKINKKFAEWDYIFELPSDFLCLVKQTNETDHEAEYDNDVLDFEDYAHVVNGTDGNIYICSTAHTSEAGNVPVTGANYATKWTLDSSEDYEGAEHEIGKAYKSAQDGKLFFTNTYSNADGDSAYIEYIPYTQAGVNDDPTKYTEPFKHALATLLAVEIELDFDRREKLLQEYEVLAKPKSRTENQKAVYVKPVTRVIDARTNLTVG